MGQYCKRIWIFTDKDYTAIDLLKTQTASSYIKTGIKQGIGDWWLYNNTIAMTMPLITEIAFQAVS